MCSALFIEQNKKTNDQYRQKLDNTSSPSMIDVYVLSAKSMAYSEIPVVLDHI